MKRFALIMIDMQRGFLDPASPLCIPSAAATVPACAAAMDACRRAGTPVVYATRHYRADGSDVERCRREVWFARRTATLRSLPAGDVRRVSGGVHR